MLETGDKIKIKSPFHITEKEKKNEKYKISSLLSDTRIHNYFNRLLNSELDKSLNEDYYKQLYDMKILELMEYKIFLELQLESNEKNKIKIINVINNQLYKLKDELVANENETLFSEENKYDILDNYKSDIQIYHNNYAPINNINLDLYSNHLLQFEQIEQKYIDNYNNLN